MKKIIGLALILVTFASCAVKPVVWNTNYDEAVAIAQEESKNMLVFFSGLEQNGPSQQLKTSILDAPEFAKAAKNLVLLNIDLPADPEAVDEETRTKIISVLNQYAVSSLPMVLLANSNGLPFSNLPYDGTSTEKEAFITLLKNELKAESSRQDLRAKIEKETGIKKVQLIDELYEATGEKYKDNTFDLLTQIPALDPNNESGLVGKYTFIMLYPQAFLEAYMGNMDKAVQIFLDFVENPYASTPEIQQAYYVAAYFMSQTPDTDYDAVFELMQKAYDTDPDSEFAPEIAGAQKQLKDMLEQLASSEEAHSEE